MQSRKGHPGRLSLEPRRLGLKDSELTHTNFGSAKATMLAPDGTPFDFPPPATIATN